VKELQECVQSENDEYQTHQNPSNRNNDFHNFLLSFISFLHGSYLYYLSKKITEWRRGRVSTPIDQLLKAVF
jgi:hypothetical protein